MSYHIISLLCSWFDLAADGEAAGLRGDGDDGVGGGRRDSRLLEGGPTDGQTRVDRLSLSLELTHFCSKFPKNFKIFKFPQVSSLLLKRFLALPLKSRDNSSSFFITGGYDGKRNNAYMYVTFTCR